MALSYNSPPIPKEKSRTCKTINFQDCLFPFTYKGEVYHNCTDTEDTRFWCATNKNKGSIDEFDYCNQDCLGFFGKRSVSTTFALNRRIAPNTSYTYYLIYEVLNTREDGFFAVGFLPPYEDYVDKLKLKITIQEQFHINVIGKKGVKIKKHKSKLVIAEYNYNSEDFKSHFEDILEVNYDIVLERPGVMIVDDYFLFYGIFDKQPNIPKHLIIIIQDNKDLSEIHRTFITDGISNGLDSLNSDDHFSIVYYNGGIRTMTYNRTTKVGVAYDSFTYARALIRSRGDAPTTQIMELLKKGMSLFTKTEDNSLEARIIITFCTGNVTTTSDEIHALKKKIKFSPVVNIVLLPRRGQTLNPRAWEICFQFQGNCLALKSFQSSIPMIMNYIRSPKLVNMSLRFEGATLSDDDLTALYPGYYYGGTTTFIVGHIEPTKKTFKYIFSAIGKDFENIETSGSITSEKDYTFSASLLSILPHLDFQHTSIIERIWGMVRIKHFERMIYAYAAECYSEIDEEDYVKNLDLYRHEYVKFCDIKNYGTYLSLKYGFTTDFSDLVIVWPNEITEAYRIPRPMNGSCVKSLCCALVLLTIFYYIYIHS